MRVRPRLLIYTSRVILGPVLYSEYIALAQSHPCRRYIYIRSDSSHISLHHSAAEESLRQNGRYRYRYKVYPGTTFNPKRDLPRESGYITVRKTSLSHSLVLRLSNTFPTSPRNSVGKYRSGQKGRIVIPAWPTVGIKFERSVV